MGVFDIVSRAESLARNVSEQNTINHSTDDDLHNLELEITKSNDIVVSGGGGGEGGQVTVAQPLEKLNEIGNVATDGVQLGQFLRYDGSVWTAADLTSSDIPDNNNNNGENTGLGLTAVELARKIIEGAQLWWDGINTGAIKWLKDLSLSVRNVIDNMIEWYSDLSNNLTTFLSGAGTAIKNALGSAYTNLVNWYNDVNSKLTRFLLDPVEFIGLVVQDIAVKITNLLKDDRGVVGALFEGLFLDEFDSDGVRNPVSDNTQNNIFLGLGKGLNTIGTLFVDTVNSAVGIATTLINSIFSAGTIIKTKILETLGAGLQIAIDFFSDLSDNVQDGIKLIGEFFKNSTNISQTIIDTVFGVATTSVQWLTTELPSLFTTGVTDLAEGVHRFLFGSNETADTFTTKKVKEEFDAFSVALGVAGSVGSTIQTTINNIARFLLGNTGTSSGANRALSNLSNVQINKALTFTGNGDTGNAKSIAWDLSGNLFLKQNSTANKVSLQFGSNTTEITDKSIIFVNHNSVQPMEGELKRVTLGNGTVTFMTRINGNLKDLNDIGTSTGGGTTPPVIPPVTPVGFTANQPTGSFWVPIRTYILGEELDPARLDQVFGSDDGAIGIFRLAVVDTNTPRAVLLCFKANTQWFAVEFRGVISTTRSRLGVRSNNLTYSKRKLSVVLGNVTSPPQSTLPDTIGRWALYQETDDTDDGKVIVRAFDSGIKDIDEDFHYGDSPTVRQNAGILPNTLLRLDNVTRNSITTAQADNTFGVDDGYIGYLPSDTLDPIIVKVDGYWFYSY